MAAHWVGFRRLCRQSFQLVAKAHRDYDHKLWHGLLTVPRMQTEGLLGITRAVGIPGDLRSGQWHGQETVPTTQQPSGTVRRPCRETCRHNLRDYLIRAICTPFSKMFVKAEIMFADIWGPVPVMI